MAEGSELKLFSWVYQNFDGLLSSYIAETSTSIVSAITPVAYTLFGVYVVLWGFSMVRGLIDEPVTDALMRLLKIALILGFALNVGRYQSDVVEFFMKTPDAMARVLAFKNPESGDLSTFQSIDTILNKTIDVSRAAWNEGGVLTASGIGMYFAAFWILLMGCVFCLVAGLMILIAKIAMVLLLAIGPIFILMVMFKTTQRFFDSWLGQVINYMVLMVLVLAVTSMFLALMEQIVGTAKQQVEAQAVIEACASIGVISIACVVLLFQVSPLASALAGGVALATTSGLSRVMSNTRGAALSGLRATRMGAVLGAKATAGAALVGYGAARAAGRLFRATNAVHRG